MKIQEIISYLENIAPPVYQESYDNAGLLVGSPEAEVGAALISLDTTEEVVEEAVRRKCDLIISHHPLIFNGLKKLTGDHYVERTVIRAIRHGIGIYAIHTNLDNVLEDGVNGMIADRLGLGERTVLRPRQVYRKIVLDVSSLLSGNVRESLEALSDEHPGHIEWTFVELADKRYRFKVHCPLHLAGKVRTIANHYNGALYHWPSEAERQTIGSGLLGSLHLPVPEKAFLDLMKEKMELDVFRHTRLLGRSIGKVAVCGGSGSFLLPDARKAGADVFITADFKYHQFFDAEDGILILDIGHYESEKYTVDLLHSLIRRKFPNFAALKTEVDTNPVRYYY